MTLWCVEAEVDVTTRFQSNTNYIDFPFELYLFPLHIYLSTQWRLPLLFWRLTTNSLSAVSSFVFIGLSTHRKHKKHGVFFFVQASSCALTTPRIRGERCSKLSLSRSASITDHRVKNIRPATFTSLCPAAP